MSGWDEHPHAGFPNGDPYEMPADLAALQADDALLDLIGSGGHVPSDADDELTRVLAGWRREVHAEPVKELVDTSTALAAIRAAARRPARRRDPVYGSVAAAAAVLVIAFSGVGLVAKSAQPGDHLWGVTQVLYSDYARSVETAAAVRTELNDAKVALNQGHPERARAALAHVQQQLPAIGESEGRTDLTARHRQLEQWLNEPPETGLVKPPQGPAMAPSTPNGAEATKSGNPGPSPTSIGSTTTPDRRAEVPARTFTTPSDQFMPRGDDWRRYGPGAGMPGYGGQDGGPSASDNSGVSANHGTGRGGTTAGATPGSESSTPSSVPDRRNTSGAGQDPGHVGGQRPPGPNGFSSFCDHAVPRPGFCR
jgi:Anti-sigma-D factor RsdA to sigma factor binding region